MTTATTRVRGSNVAEVGPPEPGTYNFVLRRPGLKLWPWVQHFYNAKSTARDVTHPDGVRAPTHFVKAKEHMVRLYRLGWKNVSAQWFEALERGWEHGHGFPSSAPAEARVELEELPAARNEAPRPIERPKPRGAPRVFRRLAPVIRKAGSKAKPRPGIDPNHPWEITFRDGTTARSRPVVHPDGERAATHVVFEGEHAEHLERAGWVDVTDTWSAAHARGWTASEGWPQGGELSDPSDDDPSDKELGLGTGTTLAAPEELEEASEDPEADEEPPAPPRPPQSAPTASRSKGKTAREVLEGWGREAWEKNAAKKGIPHGEDVDDATLVSKLLAAFGYGDGSGPFGSDDDEEDEDEDSPTVAITVAQLEALPYRRKKGEAGDDLLSMAERLGVDKTGTQGDLRGRIARHLGLID